MHKYVIGCTAIRFHCTAIDLHVVLMYCYREVVGWLPPLASWLSVTTVAVTLTACERGMDKRRSRAVTTNESGRTFCSKNSR